MLAIKKMPFFETVDETTERHGKDTVTIRILKNDGGTYNFAVECKLGTFIRAVHPHQNGMDYSSKEEARQAAIETIESIAKLNRGMTKHLKDFDLDGEEWFFDF